MSSVTYRFNSITALDMATKFTQNDVLICSIISSMYSHHDVMGRQCDVIYLNLLGDHIFYHYFTKIV